MICRWLHNRKYSDTPMCPCKWRMIPIENQFYGVNEVTVSGLLVGKDIIQQLKDKDLGDLVIFSNRILNEDGLVTLDDMTLDQLSNEIGTPVVVSEDTPQSFFSLLN